MIAKNPSAVPSDLIIIQRRQQEDMRRAACEAVESTKQFDFKCKWEQATDKKIRGTAVKRRVHELLQDRKRDLHDRQHRLRALLEAETAAFAQEMSSLEETPIEREARLREKLKTLKEARESERTQLASTKMEEHFLRNCEQLRTLKTQREAHVVASHRVLQVQAKQEQAAREQAVDSVYAALWDQDRQAKDEREAQEKLSRKQRAAEQAAVLLQQQQALDEYRREQSALREQDLKLRLEDEAARAEEEERSRLNAARTARKRQHAAKAAHAEAVAQRQARMAAEQDLDLRLLDAVLRQHEQDDGSALERKEAVRREAQAYRCYLQQQKAERQQLDQHLDRLFGLAAEQAWQRREEQWERERLARESLMNDVLATRRQQIQAKQDSVAARQAEAERDSAALEQAIVLAKKAAEEEQARGALAARKHAVDLQQQIAANADARGKVVAAQAEQEALLLRATEMADERAREALRTLGLSSS